MIYSAEVEQITCVAKGANHGSAPIPQEGREDEQLLHHVNYL